VLSIVDVVHDRYRDQLKRSQLQTHPTLARCPQWAIRRIAAIADEVSFAPGDVLAEQGRSPRWFFLISSGTAELERDGVALAVVGAGESYGEVALLGRGAHPATLRAITSVRAWVIGCQRFSPLVQDVRWLREELDASVARQPELVALARAEMAKHVRATARTSLEHKPWVTRPYVSRLPGRSARQWRAAVSPGSLRYALTVMAVVLLAAVTAAAFYHPPYAVIRPGPVVDVTRDIEIAGVPVHAPHGRYLLVTVRAQRASLLTLAGVALRGGASFERVRRPTPSAAVEARHRVDAEFAQSQKDAVIAAATALGIPGAASGRLPFTVRFGQHDVVGPSAGLVYALAIDDLLSGADFAHGRVIAATGEIDGAGDVGSVGYVHAKALGARQAGARLLLTPTSDAYQVDGAMPVFGVSSLADAVDQLSRS